MAKGGCLLGGGCVDGAWTCGLVFPHAFTQAFGGKRR